MLISIIILSHCCLSIRNQRGRIDLSRDTAHFLLVDTVDYFQASGDIKVRFNEELFRGKIDIILKEKTNFELTVYNPFSMIIASVRSDNDSVFMEIGESKYSRCLTDTINSFSLFPPVPFNFSDLIRILSGRILKIEYLVNEIQVSRGNVINFQRDSLEFFVVLSKNRLKVKSVKCIISHKDSLWSTEFLKFRNGFSEKIQIKSNKSDYFALKLNITNYKL